MKFTTITVAVFTLFSVVACGKKEMPIDDRVREIENKAMYKCIDDSLYHRLGGDVWVDKGVKCKVVP